MATRQIIALGGGGFSMEPDNLLLDRYILEQANTARPSICFLPTASGDSSQYIVNFYTAYTRLDCTPSHITLFNRTPDLRETAAPLRISSSWAEATPRACWRCGGSGICPPSCARRGTRTLCWLASAPAPSAGSSRVSPTRARQGWPCWTAWDSYREAAARTSTARQSAGPRFTDSWRPAKSSPATRWTTVSPFTSWEASCSVSSRRARMQRRTAWPRVRG